MWASVIAYSHAFVTAVGIKTSRCAGSSGSRSAAMVILVVAFQLLLGIAACFKITHFGLPKY